jgi:urease beta subunit
MRPGEVIPADGPPLVAEHPRTASIAVHNSGRFPAYLTSHFPLVGASRALEFDRSGLEGARPRLVAGSSVRIGPGDTVAIEITWS